MPAIAYLKKVLNFSLVEWGKLPDDYKDTYRRWAEEEMKVLGIE